MAFQKKTWKDRITEFPTRRTLTKSDGSTELVTVARAEGTVSQEGDAFNAASMNDLEERINQANNDLNDSLSGMVGGFADGDYTAVTGLAYDATNKKLGLKVGADTVIPFKGGKQVIDLGVGTSFNVTSYPGYESFTNANFIVEQAATPGISNARGYVIGDGQTYYVDGTFGLYKSYNANTGILTAYNYCNAGIKNHDGWTGTKAQTNSNVKAYLII